VSKRSSGSLGPRRILYVVDEWSACAWYRCNVPGTELHKRGHEVALVDRISESDLLQADIFVFLRHFSDPFLQLMKAAKAAGKLVVYDIDDALWEVTSDNPAHPLYGRPDVKRGIDACVRVADLVTTTTEPLAKLLKGRHPRVRVLPNMLPAEAWPFGTPREQTDEHVIIGWAGGTSHLEDLSLLGGVIEELLDTYPNAWFVHCGIGNVPFRLHERIRAIEGQPIEQYPDILRSFDIGLAPLRDTKFNRCKSDLKALEYSMVGIPVVASDIDGYANFLKPGVTGFLAKDATQWHEALSKLIEDRELRAKLGAQAQQAACERTIERNIGLWEEAYKLETASDATASSAPRPQAANKRRSAADRARVESRVSIIVLTYNKLEYTRRCFDRLRETTEDYELVVVDNASTDGTVEYLRELEAADGQVRVVYNTENRGFAAGCNRGVSAASCETICLLNNDTLPSPGWLDAMRFALKEDVGAVGAKLTFADGTLQHCGIVFRFQPHPVPHYVPDHRFLGQPADLREANVLEEVPGVTAACLLTTCTVWMRVGGMDQGYAVANFEDVDFNLKIRDAGLKVVYQPEAHVVHFEHGTIDGLRGSREDPMQHFHGNLDRLLRRWNAKLLAGLANVSAIEE
jgi:GT2 family glycosyltransferase/glycosyltransferase involved in cell wall biosynthesis